MIKSWRKNKTLYLKNKIVKILMKNGKKNTGEKIFLRFLKLIQKLTHQNSKTLFHSAIFNSANTFKVNEHLVKKGKRKTTKIIPFFIMNDSLRIAAALKQVAKTTAAKNKNSINFYQSLVNEILALALCNLKSSCIEQKNEVQKQIFANKRYLSKFRW